MVAAGLGCTLLPALAVPRLAAAGSGLEARPFKETGADRQMLGQVAANMRALRPPDPYKNKGVRYTGEPLRKKVGKTGASATK